jgi:hypothetical protein
MPRVGSDEQAELVAVALHDPPEIADHARIDVGAGFH